MNKNTGEHKRFSPKWSIYILVFTIVIITAFFTIRALFPPKDSSSVGVSEAPELHGLIETLKKQGFEPNPGFTTKFPPGTVIQKISRDQNGNLVNEAIPRVFCTNYDCYPNILTESAEAVLPQSAGTNSGGVQLDAKLIKTFLPQLSIDSNIIENYSLVINEPKLLFIPRGKMLGNMSMTCRKALASALDDGDQLEWFRIVDEVMAVSGFSFKVVWASKSRATMDMDYKKKTLQQLHSQFVDSMGKDGSAISFKVDDTNDRFAELTTEKQLFFAYKARPIFQVNKDR